MRVSLHVPLLVSARCGMGERGDLGPDSQEYDSFSTPIVFTQSCSFSLMSVSEEDGGKSQSAIKICVDHTKNARCSLGSITAKIRDVA